MGNDVSSIAGASIVMRQAILQESVRTGVLRLAMDTEKKAAAKLIEAMLPQTASVSRLGNNIDMYV